MTAQVFVSGTGLLCDLTLELLSQNEPLSKNFHVVHQPDLTSLPKDTQFGLVLHDAWFPSVHFRAEEVFQKARVPWLRGFAFLGESVVGPLVVPGTKGCSQCVDVRRLMADPDRQELWGYRQTLANREKPIKDAWISRTGALQTAFMLASEVQRFLEGEMTLLHDCVYFLNLKTLKTSRHFFLPNPLCSTCGDLPDDSSQLASIQLQPSPKTNAASFRCRSLDEIGTAVVHDYLDSRTGCLNAKVYDLATPFAAVNVNLPLANGDEGCAGRSHVYGESEMTAILEGLERYCGLAPRGKRTVVHDSFTNLSTLAIDPASVGLHDKEEYERGDFPFQPFHPDTPMNWVWGYSLVSERPVLVPERLAYYSLGCGDGFVYETSNGCAVGGTMVEAIFHGILEVVERDAFLMTWYARLPLTPLDPKSANDAELELMLDRLRMVAGYEVLLFNATMENQIPSVFAIAKSQKPHAANLICAAGAHLDPVRAVKSALHENAGMLLLLNEKFEAHREHCELMYRDPYEVRHMEDHSMLYSLPQAEERFDFLMAGNRKPRTFAEEFEPYVPKQDLKDDLNRLLGAFRSLNMDVVVVDQTTPELKRNGLVCVKVLIPGMLPMTFGYRLTRLEGLNRVFEVPAKLGYTKQPLRRHQLNPHPHPFP
ncbi:TOMM precursor leader peptide-binding protein [Alicyclobacillus tolerans]|uniref:TOMM precursor leader peptide-binding protein n=1 Tax=Alicyclobacillus tolerans TaxID=90970 RepID=UPI001F29F456|nr:TOMM precursor leader peptide-binding protein [Alicyclobacillus tolerans]MCF8564235.1 TOMM precursor leader peptide-binding protein [Alicyclobacillus tolerans]